MSDEELRPRVDKNEVDITELRQLVNTLIVDLVRPATEVAVAAQERSVENERRFQNLLDEAREDRMNSQRKFEEWQRQSDESQRRFDAQQEDNRRRFEAQQEVIQSMLMQIIDIDSSEEE
ncbi:MAG: hypothetical protein WA885_14665 [Phormidesmis sp.]